MRRRGSKVVSHARRSGEVGGFHAFSWILMYFWGFHRFLRFSMNFRSQGSRPLPPVAIEMMPLKKPLLDSLLIIDSSVHRFIGSGRQILAAGLAGLLAGWLAGLLTGCLLLAAGWKDDERGGLPTSKDVSHARRS